MPTRLAHQNNKPEATDEWNKAYEIPSPAFARVSYPTEANRNTRKDLCKYIGKKYKLGYYTIGRRRVNKSKKHNRCDYVSEKEPPILRSCCLAAVCK